MSKGKLKEKQQKRKIFSFLENSPMSSFVVFIVYQFDADEYFCKDLGFTYMYILITFSFFTRV